MGGPPPSRVSVRKAPMPAPSMVLFLMAAMKTGSPLKSLRTFHTWSAEALMRVLILTLDMISSFFQCKLHCARRPSTALLCRFTCSRYGIHRHDDRRHDGVEKVAERKIGNKSAGHDRVQVPDIPENSRQGRISANKRLRA